MTQTILMSVIANTFAGILGKEALFLQVSKLIKCKPRSSGGHLDLFDDKYNT